MMNIYDLNKLLASLDPVGDKELIAFYEKKKEELLTNILQKVNNDLPELKGLNTMIVDYAIKLGTENGVGLIVKKTEGRDLPVLELQLSNNPIEQLIDIKSYALQGRVQLQIDFGIYQLDEVQNENFITTYKMNEAGITDKLETFQSDDLVGAKVFVDISYDKAVSAEIG